MPTLTLRSSRFLAILAIFLGVSIWLTYPAARGQADKPTTPDVKPILVELFTSEGCSSCPPADQLLANIDEHQPIAGAQLIVLSEHVTYWNHEGWKDPFSSDAATDRQNEYGVHFALNSVYTPQTVVDGDSQMVGSDVRGLKHALELAAAKPKIPLTIENAQWSGNSVTAQLGSGPFQKAVLMAALADDSDQTTVLRGENKGRDLRHVAVVRTLIEIRKTAGPLDKLPIQIKLPSGVQPQPKMRLVVFLADPRSGRVLGAAMQPVTR